MGLMRKLLAKKFCLTLCVAGAMPFAAGAQTIAEKKAGVVFGTGELTPEMQKFLVELNNEIVEKQAEISRLQGKVMELYLSEAPPSSYQQLLAQINEVKENLRILEDSWREMAIKSNAQRDAYALWHQPSTTLEQLVMDYGSTDYVYLISPDIGQIKMTIGSNIPIPRASWGEMLEQILLQNGVGIKQLNPYLRQLYFIHDDLSSIQLITANAQDLEAYPSNARVAFVLTPEPMDVRRIWYFLEKFVDPNSTVLQRIGRAILLVGEVSAVKDVLKIYDFVAANKKELEYKAVPLFRVDAEEMAKILSAIFQQLAEEVQTEEAPPGTKDQKGKKPPASPPPQTSKKSNQEFNTLNVVALAKVAQAVFLIGTKEEIQRAEDIIHQVETQVGEARDKSIFWYNVKHSDPEEIAQVMIKIYTLMIENRIGVPKKEEAELNKEEREKIAKQQDRLNQAVDQAKVATELPHVSYFAPPFYQQGEYNINPAPITTKQQPKKQYNVGRDNFIVDPKTGSLVMVVETDLIPKLKDVIKKLDVPKRMVQIDVLLFERTMKRETGAGLNMLKLGSAASNVRKSAMEFLDGVPSGLAHCLGVDPCVATGVTDFFFSRKRHGDGFPNGFPAFDIAYNFLLTQDNVSLNASPTVVTMNQTEAVIAIQEERSIQVGTTFPETNAGVASQNVFTRAQYGITIVVTPTIHIVDEEAFFEDPINYVSLVCEITFDTFPPGQELSQQPLVNRRQVVNEVRVPDGQTVIIGGLRRRQTDDSSERVPYLGEIPGLGKLFSHTRIRDDDTEMIVFITPKIISEPVEDFAKLRMEYLARRPGDIPIFMAKLLEALDCEQNRLFQGFMTILCGRPMTRFICEEREYDGR